MLEWKNMAWIKNNFLALLFFSLLGAGVFLGHHWWQEQKKPVGPYHWLAQQVELQKKEKCDISSSERRMALAKMLDLHRTHIHSMWKNRDGSAFPEFKMESVGPIFLRTAKEKEAKQEFEQSVWSWEESHGIFLRSQQKVDDPSVRQLWLDLDTSVKYLLEKDFFRVVKGKKFLEPELTEHQFRRLSAVKRVSKSRIAVNLDPGEFRGFEKKIQTILEKAWNTPNGKIEILWGPSPDAYRLVPHFQSGRSFVNHRTKEMRIANYAFTTTVAHEFGHVLGFDDHYYSVWNDLNCYYTQKSRLTDLMSNSEHGTVQKEHWDILDRAYPWKSDQGYENFSYFFRKDQK